MVFRWAASGDDSGMVCIWDAEEEYKRVNSFTGPYVDHVPD